jgi:hypothetical protein
MNLDFYWRWRRVRGFTDMSFSSHSGPGVFMDHTRRSTILLFEPTHGCIDARRSNMLQQLITGGDTRSSAIKLQSDLARKVASACRFKQCMLKFLHSLITVFPPKRLVLITTINFVLSIYHRVTFPIHQNFSKIGSIGLSIYLLNAPKRFVYRSRRHSVVVRHSFNNPAITLIA